MKQIKLILLFILYTDVGYAQTSDSISYRDVYNFNIGDEFHVFEEHPYQTKKSILKVLSIDSTSITDTIKYTFERKLHVVTRNFSTTTHYFEDTIYTKYNYTGFYVVEPIADTCITDTSGTEICTYDTTIVNTSVGVNGRKGYQKTTFKQSKYTNGDIRTVRIVDIAVIGLGMLKDNYYTFHNNNSNGSQVVELVYYKKGTETWGSPFLLDTQLQKNIYIGKYFSYPNPAHGKLYFNNGHYISNYYIQNMQGNILLSGTLSTSQIDISDLKKGIYILSGVFEDGTFINQKIVKE